MSMSMILKRIFNKQSKLRMLNDQMCVYANKPKIIFPLQNESQLRFLIQNAPKYESMSVAQGANDNHYY